MVDSYLDGWGELLETIRGLRLTSVDSYRRQVKEFFNWLEGNGCSREVERITRDQIEGYLKWCFYQGNSNVTRGTKLIAIGSFYRYLVYKKIIPKDITADIPRPKVATTFVQKLKREEILKLFGAINILTEKGIRDAVILILGVFCGFRAGEIIKLRVNDIVMDGDGPIDINVINEPKGEPREVYLWKVPSEIVKRWVVIRVNQGVRGDDALLVSYGKGDRLKGKQLNHSALDQLIKGLAKKAGVKRPKPGIKMHMLRATHASDLRQINGYDLPAIAQRLGHKSISTTDRYIPVRGRIHKEYRSLAAYWSAFPGVWKEKER